MWRPVLAAVLCAMPSAVTAAEPIPQIPSPEAMIVLIRSSLIALNQANITNNYTVLNGIGSPTFREANPPQRLAQTFAGCRAANIDLASVAYVTPQLNEQPRLSNGRMRLTGYFPTEPMRIDYDLQFEPSGGVWRLFSLGVNLVPAAAPRTEKPGR